MKRSEDQVALEAGEYEEPRLEENLKAATTRKYKAYMKQTKLKFPPRLFKA